MKEIRMDETVIVEELTRREVEVMRLLQDRRGLTYKQIGEELGISWMTVRYHVHSVYRKLGIGGDGARVRVMGQMRVVGVMRSRATTDYTDYTD